MREHSRYDYSPITLRPRWKLPNDARVALWLIPNIEHFLFDRPSTSVSSVGAALNPDVLNYSWRDYGVRVGIWRLMEIMEQVRDQRHGRAEFRCLRALSADHRSGPATGLGMDGSRQDQFRTPDRAQGGPGTRSHPRGRRDDRFRNRSAAARLAEPGDVRDREHAGPAGGSRSRLCLQLGQRRAALSVEGAERIPTLDAVLCRDQRHPRLHQLQAFSRRVPPGNLRPVRRAV